MRGSVVERDLVADAHIVANEARTAANKRTGKGITTNGFGNDCTAEGTNAAALKIVLQASRKSGRAKRHDKKSLFPHVTLPLVMVFIVANSSVFFAS
jgi:hypothetical protein